MDERLQHLQDEHGVFTRADMLELGYDDRTIKQGLRAKHWHRVRHGAYCFHHTWASLSEEARHLVLARAVARSMTGRVALSHTSAMVAHGCPVWGADLSRVHVTRLDEGAGRIERDVHHHLGATPDSDLVQLHGLNVIEPTRAVLETATMVGTEAGLVVADGALHLGLTDPDLLMSGLAAMNHWPGSQKVQLVVRLADGRAESVGESRSRYLFWSQGLPSPVLQMEVRDATGSLVGIVDFAWPEHRVFGEFDGRVKYSRYLRQGEEPGDAVFREKRREDRIRELTGFAVGRLTWADLGTPTVTAARFRALLGHAA